MAAAPIEVGDISSGELTKVGGTDIHLPATRGGQDEIFKSLFGPLANEIGRGLAADYRRSQQEELSLSETENLRQHADAVRARQGASRKQPTRKQRKKLFEWIDEASEADPETSPEEAAKWQAVLAEILGKNDQMSLDLLKKLNRYDVRSILELSEDGGALSDGQSSRLAGLGIVEKRPLLKNPTFIPLLLIASFTILAFVNINLVDAFFSMDVSARNLFFQISMAAVSGICLLAYLWVRQSSRVYFTPLGLEIKMKISRFTSHMN